MLAPEQFRDGKEKPRLRSCSADLSTPSSSERSSFSLCAKDGSEIPLPHHRREMSAEKKIKTDGCDKQNGTMLL